MCAPARASWTPHVRAAESYAGARHGTIAFAICTADGCRGHDVQRTFPSASLLKPMLLLAYLDRGAVRSRRLTPSQGALLRPMIERSDNGAAQRVLNIVGLPRLRRLARRAGMKRFTPVYSPWGLSRIDAIDQARFFLHIDALVAPRHRRFAMTLLRSIVAPQRWGIGRLALPAGWTLYFKGGWGSGTGWVDHQSALLVSAERRISLSILTFEDGSHAYGKQTLRGIAARLLRGLR